METNTKNDFIILTDTRQQKEAHINQVFDEAEILHIRTTLPSGDYIAVRYDSERGFYKDYSIIIDTKKDLAEVCGNLCSKDHRRIIDEVTTAKQLGCKHFIFLIGDSKINSVEDIINWKHKKIKTPGERLYKTMKTFKEHHKCSFIFCKRNELGKYIIKLLTEIKQ